MHMHILDFFSNRSQWIKQARHKKNHRKYAVSIFCVKPTIKECFFRKYLYFCIVQQQIRTGMYTYEYPHPAVTADAVVFGFDGKSLNLLLINRGIEPYKGSWALPGGFININETAEDGALRELKEETGVEDIYLEQFHTFTAVDRDPRERVMTIAFLAFIRQDDYSVVAGDDAAKAQWYPVNQLPELAFDHKEIIQIALDKLRWKIMYEPLVFHLLNETFTMTQLQTIYEAVIGKELDRRNFNKKMLQLGYVVPTEERVQGVGRPGTLYMFDEEKYREQINNRNVF